MTRTEYILSLLKAIDWFVYGYLALLLIVGPIGCYLEWKESKTRNPKC